MKGTLKGAGPGVLLTFLTGKTRCNQVEFRCGCNPDSESALLGELNIEH